MTNMKPPSSGDDVAAATASTPATKLLTLPGTSSSSTQTPHHSNSNRMNPAASSANGCSFAGTNGNSSNANGNGPGCFIKPSLSLNSLPPQAPAEGSEMAQNRLRIDRPYNSLKKKRDSERELWRRSWGSGHSHSSCSLQSSTTTGGIGKDDFWAALQTNYNFIMDTNLLDSCREARGELGQGPVMRAEDDDVDYYQKAMYKPSPMQTFYGDPRLLRQWIKEMETRIARIPSVTETKKLNIEQLLKLSGDHSEIHREIVSNSRAVAACVRAYEKKSAKASRNSSAGLSASNCSGQTSLTSTTSSSGTGSTATGGVACGAGSYGEPSGSGSLTPEIDQCQPGPSGVSYYRQRPAEGTPTAKLGSGKSKENSIVKGLERRYHLLYLKAIEIQCLLEGLLDNKTSSSDNNASLSDTDEEPVNKLARLSSCNKSKSPGSLPNDECLSGEEWVKAKKLSSAGFDADSEGSDCEIVPKIISYHHQQHHHLLSPTTTTATNTTSNTSANTPSTPSPLPDAATLVLLPPEAAATANPMMETTDILNFSTNTTSGTTTTSTTSTTVASAKEHAGGKLSGADIIDGIIREATAAQDLINNNGDQNNTTSSSNTSNDENSNPQPMLLGKTSSPKAKNAGKHSGGKQKRSKINDLSKFNRSTRKSKNCATFYFKHLDTDSELNHKDPGERTKSEESSSSSEGDEGWVYNNGEGVQEGDVSQDSTGSETKQITLGDEDEKENKPGSEDKQDGKQQHQQNMVAIGHGKDSTGGVKSKKCLDFSAEALAGINLSSRALMMTSIGSFGKSNDSMDSGGAGKGGALVTSKYATSSIHRLVLNAESLVRDEIFAKTATATTPHKTVVKNPHYLHHHHHHHHHHHQQQRSNSGSNNNSPNSNHNSIVVSNNSANSSACNSGNRKAMSNHKINRIEEWLEKQPLDVAATAPLLPGSGPTTDCEASGEYTDSDSITRDTDSSEGLANSVATCLQGDQTSQEMLLSTDNVYPSETSNVSNDEVESKNRDSANSNPSLVKRRVRDKPSGERPWSVSCISQLNTSAVEINQYGTRCHESSHQTQRLTASFSISESALNNMSVVRGTMKTSTSAGGGSQQPLVVVKSSDSKGSLKKRKMRARRKNRIDESGSDESQPPTQQSSALHLLQHSIILQHQQQLLQQQHQLPLREIQLSTGGGGSSSGSGRQYRHHQSSIGGNRAAVTAASQGLLKSESFSGRIRLADDLVTLSSLSGSSGSRKSSSARQTTRGTALTTMMASSLSALAAASVAKSSKSSAADSEEEHMHHQNHHPSGVTAPMAKPNFKIGSSVTRARCGGSLNLGSLAALANYNLDNGAVAAERRSEPDLNGTGTGTEEMSSFSEQAWDNYQEKYMSEPYSEDRDTDAARRLLDFGDDYRNFIDSQSDCASSSLSAANMDSLSPPRFRKHGEGSSLMHGGTGGSTGKGSDPSVASSLNQRRKRLDEYRMDDRYSHNMHSWSSKSGSPPHHHHHQYHHLDKTLTLSSRGSKHHGVLYESPSDHSSSLASPGVSTSGGGGGGPLVLSASGRRRSLRSVDKHNTFLRSLSHETSSSSNNEFDEDMDAEVKKLLIQSKMRLANTEALKAKSHLLKPEDYDEIIKTCQENVRCLQTVLLSQPGTVLTAAKCQDLRDTILCWEKLLSWSERRQITTRFQADIQALKDGLDELGCKAFDFSSEAHIQLAIDQLKNERKVLQNQRPKMLTLNATVHSWVSQQELQRKELLDATSIDGHLEQLDREKNYAKCPDQKCNSCYECLSELREDCTINRDLKDSIGQLYGTWDEAEVRIRNRIENLTSSMMTWKQLEDGLSDFRDILDRDRGKLRGIAGALQAGAGRTDELVSSVKEVVEALSERVDPLFQEHNLPIPVNLKLSSSGSLSDSGISDGGGMSDGSLSEREKRLSALKRLVKQLEVALAPGSEAMQTITKRLEMAEHDLRSLQNTCRKIIMNEKGAGVGPAGVGDAVDGEHGKDGDQGDNNNEASAKNKNKSKHGSKKNRPSSPSSASSKSHSSRQSLNELDHHEDHFQIESLHGAAATGATDRNSHLQHQHQAATAQLGLIQTTKMKLSQNRWVWRITKIAVPVQLALVLVMCAACFFEPHCCDALNTYSMSFTPQLRYIKGPPPV